MRRIVRALGISARTAERSIGITGAQLFVLRVLDAHPAQSLNELAALTFTHQSTVSVVVDRLVSRGFVTRSRSETDGRRVVLALTTSGRRALRHAPPPTQMRLITAINSLSPGRRRELAKALKAVVDAMDVAGGTMGLLFDDPVSPIARGRHRR
jgi:MarR family transcriptional regulator, lower aerobic nicotinate degradation pathway regulator